MKKLLIGIAIFTLITINANAKRPITYDDYESEIVAITSITNLSCSGFISMNECIVGMKKIYTLAQKDPSIFAGKNFDRLYITVTNRETTGSGWVHINFNETNNEIEKFLKQQLWQ